MADLTEVPLGKAKQAQSFHDFFQKQSAVIGKDIEQLKDISVTGGERADAIEHCLASIAKLSGDVKDAATYIPPYDQKTYSDALRSLSAAFDTTRAAVAPRAKFSFKSGRKNASAVSINDASKLDSSGLGMAPSGAASSDAGLSALSSTTPSVAPTPRTRTPEPKAQPGDTKASTHEAANKNRNGVQILNAADKCCIIGPLPGDTQSPTAIVGNVQRCFIDLTRRPPRNSSSPESTESPPFASVTLKDISNSWIIIGRIAGPIHMTNVQGSILFISCRQFRMHDSGETQVYLYSASRPIIEDCNGIVFAPLPAVFAQDEQSRSASKHTGGFAQEEDEYGRNMWDQVDDFKWLKVGPSPHYQLEGEVPTSQILLNPTVMGKLYDLGPSGSKAATFDDVVDVLS